MMTNAQTQIVRQFNHLAPRQLTYQGKRYSRDPMRSVAVYGNNEDVRFNFHARKGKDEVLVAALGFEVVLNGDDTYTIAVTRWSHAGGLEIVAHWSHVGWEIFEEIGRHLAYAERKAAQAASVAP